jgi:predicted acetyltransferase
MATALLGGELRTAHALGLPLAILTVSESVIYGRWGFGPATWATAWRVDTKRVRWAGGETPGRLSFTEPDAYEQTGTEVLDRVMAARPGEIGLEPYLAKRLIGPLKGDPQAEKARLVRYDSAHGEPQGFVSYALSGGEDDFTRHSVEVRHLAAATPEALRALWRFLIELDLVAEVTLYTRGVDEPVQALVNDIRGARVTELQDHLWVRILDVPAALQARTYERDGSLVLDVSDDFGLAGGRFRLTVQDGRAEVAPTEDPADVTLPVAALGSAYLGHDVVRGLALAGRIRGDAGALDRLFRTAVPPRLSTWF